MLARVLKKLGLNFKELVRAMVTFGQIALFFTSLILQYLDMGHENEIVLDTQYEGVYRDDGLDHFSDVMQKHGKLEHLGSGSGPEGEHIHIHIVQQHFAPQAAALGSLILSYPMYYAAYLAVMRKAPNVEFLMSV